jgi:hypothetical protein
MYVANLSQLYLIKILTLIFIYSWNIHYIKKNLNESSRSEFDIVGLHFVQSFVLLAILIKSLRCISILNKVWIIFNGQHSLDSFCVYVRYQI